MNQCLLFFFSCFFCKRHSNSPCTKSNIMFYNHYVWIYINNNNDTNRGGTNEFISFYLQSLAARGERHKIIKAYANHTMLIPPPTDTHTDRAHLVVFKISPGRDPKWSAFQIKKKTTVRFNNRNLTYSLFQNPQILRTSLPGMTSSAHSILSNGRPAYFLSGGLLWKMMIVIFFAPSDYCTWTKRHRIVQSLTELNNKIQFKKNDSYKKYIIFII